MAAKLHSRSEKGTMLPEAAIVFLMGLIVFVIGLLVWRAVQSNQRPSLLSDELSLNCLTITNENGNISAGEVSAYNCVRLRGGDDKLAINNGLKVIESGPGNNTITIDKGVTDAEVIYDRGNDLYRLHNKKLTLDLRQFHMDQLHFAFRQQTVYTIDPSKRFDARHPVISDLLIHTPKGTITLAGYLTDKPTLHIATQKSDLYDTEIRHLGIANQETSGSDTIYGTDASDTISPGAGNDRVFAGPGDDIIRYTSGNDIYDAGPGQDVLEIPGVSSRSAHFSLMANFKDLAITIPGRGRILLVDEATYPAGSPQERFAFVAFADTTLDYNAIMHRAITDNETPNNDRVFGTPGNDVINAGAGRNIIFANAGDDTIVHTTGDDIIENGRQAALGFDTLDLRPLKSSQVKIRTDVNGDLIIATPTGNVMAIREFSLAMIPNETPVDQIRFADTTIQSVQLRNRLYPDAAKPRAMPSDSKSGPKLPPPIIGSQTISAPTPPSDIPTATPTPTAEPTPALGKSVPSTPPSPVQGGD